MASRASTGVEEWVIRASFVLLACVAVWSVFGDDLVELLSPPSSSTVATSGGDSSAKPAR
jgi:hypothetical protein